MNIQQFLFQLLYLAAQVFHNLPGLTYVPHGFSGFSHRPLWKGQLWEWPTYVSIPAGTVELGCVAEEAIRFMDFENE